MNRIHIVGSSGSGKTTFSAELARKFGIPHIELDAIYHQANWKKLEDDEFIRKVDSATEGSRWVVDGNYSTANKVLWNKADTLIFLDLPILMVLFRTTRRSINRILTKEILWNGNSETWASILSLKRDQNLLLWTISKHRKRRAILTGPELLQNFPNLQLIRLQSPREIEHFLESQ